MLKFSKYLVKGLLIIGCMVFGWFGGWFSGDFCKQKGTDSIGMTLIVLGALLFVIIIHILLHTIVHEAGHMVAGFLTGYELICFRIGSLTLIKGSDKKFHLKKMTVQGTGGQCLMAPPDVPIEECPYKLYHLSGGLANIITGIIAILLLIFVLPINIYTYGILGEFAIVGFMIGASNLIPMKNGGIQNDGANLLDVSKDVKARELINLILELNARFVVAKTVDDIPENLMNKILSMDFTEMDLSNIAVANAFSMQIAMNSLLGDKEKAYELSQKMLNTTGILDIFVNEAKCDCLLYELAYSENRDEDIIKKFYDEKLQKYIKETSVHPARQLVLYAYYHLYKKDEKLAEEAYERLLENAKTHAIQLEADEVVKEANVIKNLEKWA